MSISIHHPRHRLYTSKIPWGLLMITGKILCILVSKLDVFVTLIDVVKCTVITSDFLPVISTDESSACLLV